MIQHNSKIKKAFRKIKKQAVALGKAYADAEVATFGASVAYYSVFSLAPVLLIAISITGIFLERSAAQASIVSQFRSTLGQGGADMIQSLIQSNVPQSTNILLVIVGFIVILISAAGIFSQLQLALDAIFERLPKKEGAGVWHTIRHQVISYGMVLSVGFLLFASLVLSALLKGFSGYISDFIPGVTLIAQGVGALISFALITFFLALIYKLLPSKRLDWLPALFGGLIASILFDISRYLLGLYFGTHSFAIYGAASALVLLILWVYYLSQVFLCSAIIVRLYIVSALNPLSPRSSHTAGTVHAKK